MLMNHLLFIIRKNELMYDVDMHRPTVTACNMYASQLPTLFTKINKVDWYNLIVWNGNHINFFYKLINCCISIADTKLCP